MPSDWRCSTPRVISRSLESSAQNSFTNLKPDPPAVPPPSSFSPPSKMAFALANRSLGVATQVRPSAQAQQGVAAVASLE